MLKKSELDEEKNEGTGVPKYETGEYQNNESAEFQNTETAKKPRPCLTF